MVRRRTLVLLDASVLVAASHSASGGSALAMEVCQGSKFRAALTVRIILEARVNISEKFGETEILRFYQQLAALEPEMAAHPSSRTLAGALVQVLSRRECPLSATNARNLSYCLHLYL